MKKGHKEEVEEAPKKEGAFKNWYDIGRKVGKYTFNKHLGGDHYEFNVRKEREEAEKILRDGQAFPDDPKSADYDAEKRGYAIGIAHSLMAKKPLYKQKDGKKRSMDSVLLGAKIYEKLGMGDREFVRKRLEKALDRVKKAAAERNPEKNPEYDRDYKLCNMEVERFLIRNSRKASERRNLERTVTAVSLIGAAIGIFFLSPNLTGNVIANLELSVTNYIGGALFLLGLIGFFISKKIF
ncbi:MAG: hypothetical protein ABIH37_05515 [archaeon]